MTTARFYAQGEWITGFSVKGHSGYAPEGEDIVCAAVSALTQATLMGLLEVVNAKAEHKTDEKRGSLKVMIRYPGREPQILLETLKRALESIEKDYPDYVSVICENGGI